jgi:hypothetical protein
MDLKTIKLLEDLRKQVDDGNEKLTKKRREGGDALLRQAVDDFIGHFSRNDFHTEETDDGACAVYGTASFVLTIQNPGPTGAHSGICLKPPAQDKVLQAEVVQSTGSAKSSTMTYGGDVQKQLQEELSFLERVLAEPVPIFKLHVREDGGREIRNKIFTSYADLLMAIYPD